MADTFNTTSRASSKGANISPIALAFSGFITTTWPLIRAERDLSGFCGMGWDPAVDAWIRDAETTHGATLAALKNVIAQPVTQDGDALLRIVARIWDRVMRSCDPAEVADLRHFILNKQRLFRMERRDAVGNAVNRLLESGLLRLQIYLNFVTRPDFDEVPLPLATSTQTSADTPTPATASTDEEMEPVT